MTEAGTLKLTLAVTRKTLVAEGIFMFELRLPSGGDLPPFSPGAHITVKAPSGQKRRYSLCNDSFERNRYVFAVKQEKAGRGGSLSLTTGVDAGAYIEVEAPENDFQMSHVDPKAYVFIAGGIGITPIRSMIKHLIRVGKTNFKLYYFARTPTQMAFREEFSGAEFADQVVLHCDNGDPEQAYDLWPVLEQQGGRHLYCCGPRVLMEAVRDMTGHWSDSSVYFEDFVGAAANHADDAPFVVILAKSGKRYEVPVRVSILDILRKNGHNLPSSCESGTCGTCRTRYCAGQADHRDLVLSDREKRDEIMICVSRARSPELTLDI